MRELVELCDKYGLWTCVSTYPSWHFPGAVLTIEVTKNKERYLIVVLTLKLFSGKIHLMPGWRSKKSFHSPAPGGTGKEEFEAYGLLASGT